MKDRKVVKVILPRRTRQIQGSFSWIDHRFINLMEGLSREENLLYLWLVLVGDRQGLSFYSDEKSASRIKMTVNEIVKARTGLIRHDLIAYRDGISQVLSLQGRIDCRSKVSWVEGRGSYVNERGVGIADTISSGDRGSVISSGGIEDRNLAKFIIKDILRKLGGE